MKKVIKIKELIGKFFYDWKFFGAKIAYYNILSFLCKKILTPPNKILEHVQTKKYILIKDFLSTKFGYLIEKYKNKVDFEHKNSKKIWCCRRQGEENAPEIVKICINSIRKNAGDYEVVLIDFNNYKEYVELPEFLEEKLKDGKISLTHFADVLRIKLLKEYGGIWTDVTMFVSTNIFNEFNDKIFNSIYPKNHIEKNYEFSKWCVFFFGGCSGKLFSFVYEVFIAYLKDYDKMIDFFLLDHLINLAYENFSDVKDAIDKVSLKNDDIFRLVEIFNQEYNDKTYEDLLEVGYFKLTYKIPFVKYTKDRKLTNYGKFIEEFGNIT